MSNEWIEVDSIEELKERVMKYRGDTHYEWQDFQFKKSGSESGDENDIAPKEHCEFEVIFNDAHIDTFSLDRMTTEEIEQKLEEMRDTNPTSMTEWLRR